MSRAEVWGAYWDGGATHSLEGSLGSDYGPELGGWWHRFFSQLPSGTSMVDLCTGPGVLCRIATKSLKNSTVIAVDLVDAPPPWFHSTVEGRGVRFLGNTSVESLPLPNSSVGAIVSQFGIEYANLDRSTAEIRRVASDDALIAIVTHSTESLPVTIARRDLPAIEWFLGAEGPFEAWQRVIGWLASTTPPSSWGTAKRNEAEADRRRFNDAARQTEDIIASTGSDLPHALMARLAALTPTLPRLAPTARALAVQSLRDEFAGVRLRTDELLQCALDPMRAESLRATLSAGLHASCRIEPATAAGHTWGWRITNFPR